MVDRQQLEAVLSRRFPGSTPEQIAAAANAIMALIRIAENPAADDGGAPSLRGRWPAPSLPQPLT